MSHRGQITDSPLYWGDKSMIGMCDEFASIEMENKTIEHETLGSVGVLILPTRGLSALTGSMTLSYPDPEFVAATARPNLAQTFQLHNKLDLFNVQGFDAEKSTTIVTGVVAQFTKRAWPTSKKGENAQYTVDFSINKMWQRDIRSNAYLMELDLFANTHKVMGENVWPD